MHLINIGVRVFNVCRCVCVCMQNGSKFVLNNDFCSYSAICRILIVCL